MATTVTSTWATSNRDRGVRDWAIDREIVSDLEVDVGVTERQRHPRPQIAVIDAADRAGRSHLDRRLVGQPPDARRGPMKSSLGLRPVHHHREDRIRGHVQLCWLALLLIRVLERTTGDTSRTCATSAAKPDSAMTGCSSNGSTRPPTKVWTPTSSCPIPDLHARRSTRSSSNTGPPLPGLELRLAGTASFCAGEAR